MPLFLGKQSIMNIFSRETYDRMTIIRIIVVVDLVQSAIMLLARASPIIFRTMLSDEDSLIFRQNQSSTFIVLFFVVIVCFYVFHVAMALKLLSALELMDLDPLSAARNAKFWQNWAILVLVFLIGNLFASVLSASTKLDIVGATLFGVCEIFWRLFAIYNVGLFIDDLIANIPAMIPTVQFFGVRFPVPAYTRSLETLQRI